MVCPFAKNIRGLVVYCEAIKRKVSSLRYPCKGDYTRCPIYRRYQRARAEEVAEAAPARRTEKTVVEERAVEATKRREERAEVAPVEAVLRASTIASSTPPLPTPSTSALEISVGEGEAACDSLIAAEIIMTSEYIGAISEKPLAVIRKLVEDSKSEEKPLFFSGDIRGVGRTRGFVFKGRVASLYLEERGGKKCGREAFKHLESIEERLVARIYRVDLESLPERFSRIIAESLKPPS